jgi:hypothetical protein
LTPPLSSGRRDVRLVAHLRALLRRPRTLRYASTEECEDSIAEGVGDDSRRVSVHGVTRGPRLTFSFDDHELVAYQGETVAAATMAHSIHTLRVTTRDAQPRGVYCGMGVCFECLVTVDGWPNQRACLTPVTSGMRVSSQLGWGRGTPGD